MCAFSSKLYNKLVSLELGKNIQTLYVLVLQYTHKLCDKIMLQSKIMFTIEVPSSLIIKLPKAFFPLIQVRNKQNLLRGWPNI